MKILVVSFDEVPSFKGASTHILSGLRQAVSSHEVVLCSLGSVQLPSQQGFKHIPLALREANYLKRALVFRREVEKLLRRERPDLVHVRSAWEGRPALEGGYKTIYEANGMASVELRYRYRSMSDNVKRFLHAEEKFCMTYSSCIITPSELVRDYIRSRHPESYRTPIFLFPNGYDPVTRFFSKTKPPLQSRRIRLVYLGTLSSWQGITWSLRSLREFRDAFTLDVFTPTNGPVRRYFEKRVTRLGLLDVVAIHEPLDRCILQNHLADADLGFAPLLKTERNTEQGGYPIKLLDYIAHGLPVLASDLRVNRQIIGENNGFLFQPSSRTSLQQTLNTISHDRDLINQRSQGAIESLSSNWTWDKYGNELQKLYSHLLLQAKPDSIELSHTVMAR